MTNDEETIQGMLDLAREVYRPQWQDWTQLFPVELIAQYGILRREVAKTKHIGKLIDHFTKYNLIFTSFEVDEIGITQTTIDFSLSLPKQIYFQINRIARRKFITKMDEYIRQFLELILFDYTAGVHLSHFEYKDTDTMFADQLESEVDDPTDLENREILNSLFGSD